MLSIPEASKNFSKVTELVDEEAKIIIMEKRSSPKRRYERKIVSEPLRRYGVDILSCSLLKCTKSAGEKDACLFFCYMDKAYSKGFHAID